ncbi:hypothetical protein Tco_0993302 [Tanacetum coccineum]|uniref:Retrovirus-related Pol polyprotein from transposon TNT 1-94-like beta-barrel domain-containing protein n=1 Tax=Tanacetum coccineum TaxID=301880 RepID=A0ABQ5F5Y3_9ASTR
MLDRTDFASWQQRIRLYCRGKENDVNIMKSIDEGPFQMGTFRETLAEGTEGALGLERPRVYCDLSPEDKERYNADIREMNILLQGLPKDIYSLINHYTDAKDIWYNVKMLLEGSELTKEDRESQLMQLNSMFVNNMLPEWGRFVTTVKLNRGLRDSNYDQLYAYLKQHKAHVNENKMQLDRFTQHTVDPLALISNGAGTAGYRGAQNKVGNANPGQARQVKCYNCNAQENRVALDEEQLLFIAGGQDNAIDEDVDEQPVQDLALNVDNVFQADDCDAFDSDVDEAPTAQTMFMANLSSADPVYDKAGPSYDSDILSEVHDHDHYQDAVCEHHEEHEMHDDVQPNYVVDSHANYTSDSNMIPYDQYVKDNAVPVVQSNVSSVPNDAYMMIYNDMYEPHAIITDHNIKEENLKKELHSVKLQLASTINHNKSMVEEVTSLKKDFKQKENKYLEEFLDMKALKEKVTIGYKNPLCLTRAKQVQPALYNGHEIIKTYHVPAIVHNSEDTLEIAKITRKKMNDKKKNPECMQKKVKIPPPDYSKENYLATFTPQKQLNPEQIFWSQDLIKIKAEALKTQATTSRPIKALTVYPPNTPATLVPRVLPTKSQNIMVAFKRLNKRSYRKERRLIFEVLEAEVHQHVVDRKHDEIERKNLLIVNDNLIADCLFKDVFHVATNSELNVSSFTEMHDAYTSLKARCLELEVELSNLRDKIEKDQVKPKVLAPGKYAIDVEPIHPHNRNNREVHLVYLKHLKESVETLREIVAKAKAERPLDSSLVSACRYTKHSQELLEYMIGTYPKGRSLAHVVQIVLWYLDSGCSKHMTGDRLRLKNFVKKFTETVRFGNDHFGAIMGYGDYVIGESVISRFTWVKFLRSKDETPEDSYRRDSTENSVVERRNRTLVEAARTMLIFSKSLMFLWAEAVAIACYT